MKVFGMVSQSKTGTTQMYMIRLKTFFTKLEASVNRHAPLKKLSQKEIRIE